MMHGSLGLRVSRSEAERIERISTQKLLQARKLTLLVDLDQTILHATVDASVEAWLRDPNHPNHAHAKVIPWSNMSCRSHGS